jgi:hypothetical protein
LQFPPITFIRFAPAPAREKFIHSIQQILDQNPLFVAQVTKPCDYHEEQHVQTLRDPEKALIPGHGAASVSAVSVTINWRTYSLYVWCRERALRLALA